MTDFRRCETIDAETRKNVARKPFAFSHTHRFGSVMFFHWFRFTRFLSIRSIFSSVFAKLSTPVPFFSQQTQYFSEFKMMPCICRGMPSHLFITATNTMTWDLIFRIRLSFSLTHSFSTSLIHSHSHSHSANQNFCTRCVHVSSCIIIAQLNLLAH